jgi:tetratricopeptide (TPR) repeat protein
MLLRIRHKPIHSTVLPGALNLLSALALLAAPAWAQNSRPTGSLVLRDELTKLIAAGRPEEAIRRVQQALREHPQDAGVRSEYVDLHLSLARAWLAQRRFADCTTALDAVRAIDPQQPQATRMLAELHAARERAGTQTAEIDRLLRLELFETALDRIRDTKALRPELAEALQDRERAAWRGAADDHYLARNFNESFALYESLLANDPNASDAVHARWCVSLALALAGGDFSTPSDANTTGRLLARAIDVLRKTREPILGKIIGGLLAERAGQLPEAGRTYCEALGIPWTLPPVDRRQAAIRKLREQVTARTEELYRDTPVERRDGFWAVALPDVWKQRHTPHFDVYARNDLVAERVAEAAEYHFSGLSAWLGTAPPDWEPRCEIRIHGTREEFRQATGTTGITFAVSHTQLQGQRVLARKLDAFQADPWLLSSTLPHELTHLLIAEARRPATLPLVIDEGLALQAEPPARWLMYRLRLAPQPPALTALLAATQTPADVEGFYAEAGTLVNWLLDRLGERPAEGPNASPVPRLLDVFRNGVPTDGWRPFGVENEAAMNKAWAAWYSARRAPYRMPLMILVEPAAEHRTRPK